MKSQKSGPDIVSVHLSPAAKAALDRACDQRGMTIKALLGRLIEWFNTMNRTEQSIILGQIEQTDVPTLAELLLDRGPVSGVARPSANARPRRAAARARG